MNTSEPKKKKFKRIRNFFSRRINNAKDSGSKIFGVPNIKQGWNLIEHLKNKIKPQSNRKESFNQAYKRLKLNEDKLEEAYNFFVVRFYIFCVFFFIAIILTVNAAVNGNATSFFGFLGFIALCLGFMFQSSFRLFQMRKRELCSATVWAAPLDEWIPPFKLEKKYSSSKEISNKSDKQNNVVSFKKNKK